MLEWVNMGFGGVSCGSTASYCKTRTTTSYCDLSNWMVKRVVMPFELYCSVLFGQIREYDTACSVEFVSSTWWSVWNRTAPNYLCSWRILWTTWFVTEWRSPMLDDLPIEKISIRPFSSVNQPLFVRYVRPTPLEVTVIVYWNCSLTLGTAKQKLLPL